MRGAYICVIPPRIKKNSKSCQIKYHDNLDLASNYTYKRKFNNVILKVYYRRDCGQIKFFDTLIPSIDASLLGVTFASILNFFLVKVASRRIVENPQAGATVSLLIRTARLGEVLHCRFVAAARTG